MLGIILNSAAVLILVMLVISGLHLVIGVAVGRRVAGRRNVDSFRSKFQADHARRAIDGVYALVGKINESTQRHTSRVAAVTKVLTPLLCGRERAQGTSLEVLAAELISANVELQEELVVARVQLDKKVAEIENRLAEARTDALTGLVNRRGFDEELARRFLEWRRHGTPVSLLMFDIDRFKQINDQHGHRAGDSVLQQIAHTLSETMRGMDVLARFGGDEFAVILPHTNLAEAAMCAERARATVSTATLKLDDLQLEISVSAGAATLMLGDHIAQLIERADAALYASKDAGCNCAHYHDGIRALPIFAPAGLSMVDLEPQNSNDRAEPVPTDSAPVEEADSHERRGAPRQTFTSHQSVAPYDRGGELPDASAFEEVQCNDLSLSGFSYMASERPDHENLVVRFSSGKNLVYVTAQIVNCTQVAEESLRPFRIGCRFEGRLEM